jgi:hypothetical protein
VQTARLSCHRFRFNEVRLALTAVSHCGTKRNGCSVGATFSDEGEVPFENVRLGRAEVSNVDQNTEAVVKKGPSPETLASLAAQLNRVIAIAIVEGQKVGDPLKKNLPPAFWIEVVLATIAALFATLSALMPDWIEQIVPANLDQHSGSLEWQLTAAVSLAAIFLSASAFREWRKSLRTS